MTGGYESKLGGYEEKIAGYEEKVEETSCERSK